MSFTVLLYRLFLVSVLIPQDVVHFRLRFAGSLVCFVSGRRGGCENLPTCLEPVASVDSLFVSFRLCPMPLLAS